MFVRLRILRAPQYLLLRLMGESIPAVPAHGLVGRDGALSTLRRAFAHEASVVTLLGPPGIGKTTLAMAFLEELPRAATLIVSLVSAQNVRDVCTRVAATAAVAVPGHLDDAEALAYVDGMLREQGYARVLFDNADPIVGHLRALLTAWPRTSSPGGLRFLVTSRERIGLPDERIVELGPLSAEEGQRLFELRAMRWQDESQESSFDPEALAQLLTALDGVPLAIELAAARANMLGLGEMQARLGSRFEWLKVPRAADETRHAGLWNAIEWSWNFLNREEQTALATLSLLSSSFTLETACALLGESESAGFSKLEALRNKSLVAVARLAQKTHFSLLESIREFARVKLAEMTEREAVHARFVNVMAERCDRVLADYEKRGFVALRPLIGVERENLHHALSLTTARTPAGFALTCALARTLQVEGHQQAFETLVASTIDADGTHLRPSDRGLLHQLHGFALFSRGRLVPALAAAESAQACEGQSEEQQAETHVLWAVCRRQEGDLTAAEEHCRTAISLVAGTQHRALGDASANLGLILAYGGRRAEARAANEQALRCFEDLGDPWGQGLALGNLGELAQEDGNFTEARHLVEAALQCLQEVRDGRYIAVYTSILAMVEHEAGLVSEALAHYATSTDRLHRLRGVHAEAAARGAYGALLAATGDRAAAEGEFQRAERLLSAGGHLFIREALSLHRLHLAPIDARRAALARASDLSHGVRFARRLLEKTLPRENVPTLTVAKDARHFVLGGTQVDLTRRGSLRRILGALVEARGSGVTPTRALSTRDLIEAGWPGEIMRDDAAGNRIRVAITTLRKLGLADVLITRDDGYVLSASIVVL